MINNEKNYILKNNLVVKMDVMPAEKEDLERLKNFNFQPEELELRRGTAPAQTLWPKPEHRYRLSHETFKESIEAQYFWILNYLHYDMDYYVDKIYDFFTASEQSAFFGMAQQRLGLQQDRVSTFLATIGKMVKELFQLVRELRILDERLSYYADSYDRESPSRESAEITLKGIYIDMVEGGAKSPASVYGMARELQFTTLPDLFFSTHPVSSRDVDEAVDKLQFNRKVREVLKRKLRAFLEWKEHTHRELKTKRKFTLKYLRQHYDIIKMYMDWVRPYLKNIRRLQMIDRTKSPDLVGAFEGSLVEIEILAKKKPRGNSVYNACILVHFNYRTRPSMEYMQPGEYQHKGPIHVGKNDMTFRTYAWTDGQIEQYKKMRSEEDFELLSNVDASVAAAMEALGDELRNYLEEAGEEFGEKKPAKKPKLNLFDPFTSLFKGFGEIFRITRKKKTKKPEQKLEAQDKINETEAAKDLANGNVWTTYKNYKKAHGMLSW